MSIATSSPRFTPMTSNGGGGFGNGGGIIMGGGGDGEGMYWWDDMMTSNHIMATATSLWCVSGDSRDVVMVIFAWACLTHRPHFSFSYPHHTGGGGSGDKGGNGNPLAAIWKGYNQLLKDQPLLTKALTSFVGFSAGDFLAQKFIDKADEVSVVLYFVCVWCVAHQLEIHLGGKVI